MDLENWCSWSDLPECYRTWETVYKRFAQWQENGKLKALFVQLREDADI
ncbi:transposase [Lachnospiraceae bacterium HCP28S3_F9]